MPFGTPGGDTQPQTMLQVFLNIAVFGMNAQEAIEAPRFQSQNFPNSFWPHAYLAGSLRLEGRIGSEIGGVLEQRGHDISWMGTYDAGTGSCCAITVDHDKGTITAGADYRRESYAIGR
jgi:gamma-glutamyltranspeptidase/glutathione hydrolase